MKQHIRISETSAPLHGMASGGWWQSRTALLLLNVLGGSAVLGSYVHGIVSNPLTRGDVWGGIPEPLKPLYTVSMLTAATGYFFFSYYVFFRIDPGQARIARRFGYGAFLLLYGLVLAFSAVWMPLTFAMLAQPSLPLWFAIRVTLTIVGLASLGILASLLTLQPRQPGIAYRAAVLGSVAFCIQTALLDALVWPAFFPL
jgi:hypothetical protein